MSGFQQQAFCFNCPENKLAFDGTVSYCAHKSRRSCVMVRNSYTGNTVSAPTKSRQPDEAYVNSIVNQMLMEV